MNFAAAPDFSLSSAIPILVPRKEPKRDISRQGNWRDFEDFNTTYLFPFGSNHRQEMAFQYKISLASTMNC